MDEAVSPVLVADLLDTNKGAWDEETIRQHLFGPDAEAVLCLLRPRGICEDIWAWNEERTGLYSVRSAHRLLLKNLPADPDLASGSDSDTGGL